MIVESVQTIKSYAVLMECMALRRRGMCRWLFRQRRTEENIGKVALCLIPDTKKAPTEFLLSGPCAYLTEEAVFRGGKRPAGTGSERYAMAMVFFSGSFFSGAFGKESLRMPSSNVAETSLGSRASPT